MRFGYRLAVIFAMSGAAAFTIVAILEPCVAYTGSLGSYLPSSASRVPVYCGWVDPGIGSILGIMWIGGLFLLGASALVALNAWHPKPTMAD
jgi:tetrahydromethanopterin S-methyltransferase subunit E